MRTRTYMRSIWLWGLVGVACCGCGPSQPRAYPVTGTVYYRDQPLENAQVTFMPSGGRPAQGTTDATGNFTLTTFDAGDGALAGMHRVTILKMEREPSAAADDPYAPSRNVLPERYGHPEKSPLEKEVTAAGPNEFRFDLTDD